MASSVAKPNPFHFPMCFLSIAQCTSTSPIVYLFEYCILLFILPATRSFLVFDFMSLLLASLVATPPTWQSAHKTLTDFNSNRCFSMLLSLAASSSPSMRSVRPFFCLHSSPSPAGMRVCDLLMQFAKWKRFRFAIRCKRGIDGRFSHQIFDSSAEGIRDPHPGCVLVNILH